MIEKLGKYTFQSSNSLITLQTRLEGLIWAPTGRGKTTLAGSLHRLTLKYLNKPTIYIAIEQGDGGGAISLQKLNLDIPIYTPPTLADLKAFLQELRGDRSFGGVVLDSGSELAKNHAKTQALKYPSREKSPVVTGPRSEGVPTQSDYQVISELERQVFQDMLNLSAAKDPEYKKHVLVIASEKMKIEPEPPHKVTFWGPDLPGAMATAAPAMFQLVGTIDLKPEVKNGKRVITRHFVTSGDDIKVLKDRYNIFPQSVQLKAYPNDPEGMDLCDMWEKFWIPQTTNKKEKESE